MPELRIIVSTEARADLLALEQYITEHDGTRAFPIAPWLIVYALLPKRDGIRVIRILDGRRDLARILGRRRRAPRKRQQQR